MRLGPHYWNFSTPGDPALIPPTLAETARIAEEAGVWSFTPMDHYFQMRHREGGAHEPMLEGYTTLGYLAEVAHKLDVLRAHCDREGRDYAAVEKTVMISRPVSDDVDALLADAERYARLDVSEIQVLPHGHPVRFAEQIAERVMPRIAVI